MRRKAKAGTGHRVFHGLRTGFEGNGGFFSGSRYHGCLFRKTAQGEKTASAGFYNSAAFCKLADEAGLSAVGVNGDAFSTECKEEVVQKAKETGGPFDLVVYSLASLAEPILLMEKLTGLA